MRKKLNGQRNQCPTCGEYFTRNSVFDKHRIGEYKNKSRKCMNKQEMIDAGMFFGDDGFWRGAKAAENAVIYSSVSA
jgi:hypothetical protein